MHLALSLHKLLECFHTLLWCRPLLSETYNIEVSFGFSSNSQPRDFYLATKVVEERLGEQEQLCCDSQVVSKIHD